MGYPDSFGSHISSQICPGGDNSGVDPTLIVVIVVVVVPVLVVGALAYSARLRGPDTPAESHRRVGALVTEAVPEEHRDDAEVDDEGPAYSIDSPPPEPDPGLRERSDR
jgi:hypothetical protein